MYETNSVIRMCGSESMVGIVHFLCSRYHPRKCRSQRKNNGKHHRYIGWPHSFPIVWWFHCRSHCFRDHDTLGFQTTVERESTISLPLFIPHFCHHQCDPRETFVKLKFLKQRKRELGPDETNQQWISQKKSSTHSTGVASDTVVLAKFHPNPWGDLKHYAHPQTWPSQYTGRLNWTWK